MKSTQQAAKISSLLSNARAAIMCARPTMRDASYMLSGYVNSLMRMGLSYDDASARVDRELLDTLLRAA